MEALGSLIPLILMLGIFWLLLIRPQQQRAKKHRELIGSVSTNDRIVTVGGLHATVKSVDEETVRVEVAPGTVVTMSKQAIARRLIEADTGLPE